MRELYTILGMMLAFSMIMGLSQAYVQITFSYPVNGSTLYPIFNTRYNLNVTLNESVNDCRLMWNNNGTTYYLSNTSTTNKTFNYSANVGWLTPPTGLNGNWQNMRYWCGNATKTWSNTSVTENLHYYKINEATFTFVERVIANNSILSALPKLNISTYSTATNCSYNYDNAGYTASSMTMSDDRLYTTNGSALSWTGTSFGKWDNITYVCEDSCGNTTTSGRYFFKLDIAKPQFPGSPTYVLDNYTSGGNYLQIYFNISDNNPSGCTAKLYYESGGVVNVSTGLSYDTSTSLANCSIQVTPSDVIKDDFVYVVPAANDAIGNQNISYTNQSYIVYRFKAGWNLITGFENKTLSQIASEFQHVTYVSSFDNSYTCKNFTTYTVGSSTYATTNVNAGNSTYIYVTEDITVMRRYYTPPVSWLNATFYTSDGTTTSWNIIGITKRITDTNATMMGNVCLNSTKNGYTGSCQNITYICYDNPTLGTCCVYRNRLATGCSGYISTNLTMPRGAGVWISTNDNITLDRGKW